jgi:hypothetical protein
VLALASEDPRVIAGAVVGSLADGDGDRWSDLDLTFAVDDGVGLDDVLADWTNTVVAELDGVHLFDLARDVSIYRVFLLPDLLQLDLSFTPASAFGAGGPKFKLLFGTAIEKPRAAPRPAAEVFGWAIVYARHARACIDRRRWWQAEHCISAVRDHALMLACRRHDLPMSFGRGFDDVPTDVLARLEGALVRSLEREELLRALAVAIAGLLGEAEEVRDLAATVEPQLRRLAATTFG